MSVRRSYAAWKAERPRAEAWAEQVIRALPTRSRQRPRDADEAALLRELGAPEELIGPVRPPAEPGTESEAARR